MTGAALDLSGLTTFVAELPPALIFVLTAVVLIAALAAATVIALTRKRRKDAQEVVLLLEEMRSGRARTRLDLDPRSPFASIAESANRLAQDLGVRWSKAESASESFTALQEAARGYAVIATDADGDLRSLSPGAVALFGWEEDAVVGRNASLLFDDGAWKDLLPKLARKSLRERGVETRALMARHDGAKFHARLLVRLLRGHGEEPSGFLLVIQDVSEHVRVETQLRDAEVRSRGILEDLPGGVALVAEGRIVYANAAMRALLHVSEMEAAGFAILTRIATTHVLLVREALTRIASAGGDPDAEATVTLLDAAGRPGREARFVAIRHQHEGRPAALVLLRDETAERRLLRTLAAQEARLDSVLDAWDDAVVAIEDDASGPRVRLANRAFVSLFNLRRSEVAGVTEIELTRALAARGAAGTAAAACLTAAVSDPPVLSVESDGRTFALRAAALPGSGSLPPMRMLLVRDVSDAQAALQLRSDETEQWKRRHESAVASYANLRGLQDELESGKAAAEALNAELRTLDTMKSDLLANVSHELQTPLVSIRGYTEMILKGRLGAVNDEQKKGLALSLKNIDRLIAMIDNLLAFARTDSEAGALALSTFPLAGVIDEALSVLAPRVEAKQLRVTKELEDAHLSARADREKILQIFLNLIGNAVKFNRERGSIDIAARRGKPGFVLVQVCDTGVGIAKDDLERVFDRFYRAGDAEAAGKEGTGIGLAIVRNILRLHGCVIHATSEPGEGTVFTFTLPLGGERFATPDPPRAVQPEPDPPRDEPVAPEPPAPREERPRLRIIRRGQVAH